MDWNVSCKKLIETQGPIGEVGKLKDNGGVSEILPDRITLSDGRKKADCPVISLEGATRVCKKKVAGRSNAGTMETAEAVLEKIKDGVREETLVNDDKHMHTIISGIPSFVKSYSHKGIKFRHYFANSEQKKKASGEQMLIAGPLCYVQKSGGIRIDFVDLTGVFLTKPGVKPEFVGVPEHNDYLDFKLPLDTAVLEIEKDKIYYVPGNPMTPGWIAEHYKTYKSGGQVPGYVMKSIEKLDKSGGVKDPVHVHFKECK